MAHVRQQIRGSVGGTVTGLTTTGSNVFVSRKRPLGKGQLPCWLVYMAPDAEGGEESEIITMGNSRTLDRIARVVLEGVAEEAGNADDLDDTLDTMAAEAEAVLGGNDLGGLVKDVELQRSEVAFDGDGDKARGVVRLIWAYRYATRENNAEVAV